MFRYLFYLILFLSIQQTGISQENKSSYGIKAGINFAELYGEDAIPESDRKTGYSAGFFGTFYVRNKLLIHSEIIWSLQGEKSEKKGRYDISYINIPLMIKWYEGVFYYEAGPQLGILTISTSTSVPDEIRLSNFETFDVSINAGIGIKINPTWTFGLRYAHGLTKLVQGADLRNSVIYLGISCIVF